MKVTVWSKVRPFFLMPVAILGIAVVMLLITWAWAWFLTLAGKLLPWP